MIFSGGVKLTGIQPAKSLGGDWRLPLSEKATGGPQRTRRRRAAPNCDRLVGCFFRPVGCGRSRENGSGRRRYAVERETTPSLGPSGCRRNQSDMFRP